MKKSTRYTLWVAISIMGILYPTVVILEIIRNDIWWSLAFLPWAIWIMVFTYSLLGRGNKEVGP